MGQTVKLRRSAVSGRVPINSQLQLGELSVNTADGKLFFAKSGSFGPSIEEIITTNTQNTGSIDLVGALTASVVSSSFIGDGSELYNIPASGVVGLSLDQISSDGAVAAITAEQLDINVNTVIDGSLTATEITGSGLGLTNVPVNISGSSHTSTNYNGLFTKIHFDESTGIKVEGDTSTGIAKIYLDGVASEGGESGVGSTKFIEVTSPSSTWTFNHGLGEKYPSIMVFDSNNNVIIPQNIEAVSTTQLVVSFASPQIGYVTATVGGGLPTTTASDNKTLVTLSGVPTWKEGILSGSVSFNSFSSSIDTIIGSLETESGSVRTTLNTYTSSNNIRVDSIESKTGSFLIDSDLSTLEGQVSSLETTSGSHDGRLDSIESKTGSFLVDSDLSTLEGQVGSLETESGSVRSTLNTYTSSNDGRVDSIESQTGSYLIDSDLSTLEGQVGSLETESGSVRSALNTYTSSNDSRVEELVGFKDDTETAIELTGSNVTIKGNLLVKGTETRVNSTTVEVSDNVISLNGSGAANGGIEVRDVTSPGILSGSLIWDGTDNKWKGGVKGSEENLVLDGDFSTYRQQTDNRLGSLETSTSSLNSFTSSINTTIKSKLDTEGVISGSIQIDHDLTTNFVANEHIDHSSITIGSGKGLEGGGTIDTNRSLSLNTGSLHFLDGVKSKLNTETVVSGSEQIDITGTTNYNLVDGRLDSLESNSGSYQDGYDYSQIGHLPLSGGTITGDVRFLDSDQLRLGDGNDLRLWHNGTNSYVFNYNGDLNVGSRNGDLKFLGSNGSTGEETYFFLDGSQQNVNFQKDAIFTDNKKVLFGGSGDLQIFHDGSNSYINEVGTGDLYVQTNGTNMFLRDNTSGNTFIAMNTGTSDVSLKQGGNTKLTTESTGISVTGIITATGGTSTNWNAAYGWGDHASVGYITGFTNTNEFTTGATFNSGNGVVTFTRNNGGDTFTVDLDGRYLTSFTETDPVFTASPSAGITDTNISNWNTAYTYSTVGHLPLSGGTMTGNIVLSDNDELRVGVDSDLRIYHNGTNNFILNTIGDLNIRQTADDGNITFQSDDGLGSYTNYFIIDGGNKQTQVYEDFRFQDNVKVKLGNSSDFQIYHDPLLGSIMSDNGPGDLFIDTNQSIKFRKTGTNELMTEMVPDGSVSLYHDNSKKLETTSTGVSVTGTLSASGYNDGNWNTAYGWGDHSLEGYLTSYNDEYTTGVTWTAGTATLTFTRNDGDTYDVQMLETLTDVTVTGGTYASGTQILTLTKSDGSTVDVSGFAIDTDVNWYTTGATFNTGNGVITGTRSDGGTWTVDIDNRYLQLGGGTLTGNLTLNSTNPEILFNGTSDAGVDMAIKATPEGLDFYEPEDSNKIHFQILDDTGVNAAFGLQIGGTQVLSSGRVLSNVTGNISMFTNDSNYLTSFTETDPIFTASPSFGITNTNISNWNTSYGWGNHASVGYITGYSEVDTLDSVTTRGATTSNDITVGKLTSTWGEFTTTNNTNPGVDDLNVSGFGVLGNRNTNPIYLHNFGDGGVRIGVNTTLGNGANGVFINDTTSTFYTDVTVTGTLTASGYNDSNWNTAYGWGDHSGNYLPIVGGTLSGGLQINLTNEGTYFTGGSGGLRQLSITSGTNSSAHALHTFNIASTNGKYRFSVDGTEQLSLNSTSATFAGTLSASGYNDGNWNTSYGWGDHDGLYLPIGGGTITGDLTVNGKITQSGVVDREEWGRTYAASITTIATLVTSDGSALPTGGAYRMTGHISGTGTEQVSMAVFWNENGTWYCNNTFAGGVSSNHIEFLISGGVPKIKTWHPNDYNINVSHERLSLDEGIGTDNLRGYFGSDSFLKWTESTNALVVPGTIAATGGNSGNWNTAYGWGDHSTEGYITGYVNTNEFVTGATFNSSNGVITFTRNNGGDTFGVDIDGRFSLSAHNHDGDYVKIKPRLNANGDTITETSVTIWDVSGASDDPTGASDGLLVTNFWDSSDWATQNFHDFHRNKLFIRSKQSGTWQSTWAEVFTTDNFTDNSTNWNTAYGWGNHSGLYLPINNPTLTGVLTLPQHLKATGSNLSFSAGGNQILNIDLNGKIYPQTDNTVDLGFSTTGLRFRAGNFSGVVTASGGNSTNWNTAYGWGNHSGNYLPIVGGTLTGDLIVGSIAKTSNTVVKVLAEQGYKAGFEAYGNGQGTGYIYVGQSTTHGGGMSYNGDSNPALVSGETDDRITFYRRTNSVDSEVFSYNHGSDSVYFNGEILPSTINTGQGSTEVHLMNQNIRTTDSPTFATINTGQGATEVHLMNQNIRTTDDVQFGKGKFSEQVSVNNRTAISVAHWAASSNTTGAIKIKVPGTHTSNWSMFVLRITTYEYNSNAHAIYYVSGHDWTSGWYQNGVTVQGSGKALSLGFSTGANEDYIILGDVGSTWQYGHVTVDVVAHPEFYSSSMDITEGWSITQETDLAGITINSVTNKQLLDTSNYGTNISNWNTAFGWGDHSTEGYATQTYVGDQIDLLVDAAPGTLDTLNELAAALGDDPNFATTITTSIGNKLPLSGGTLTGDLIIQHTDGAPGELLHLRNDSNGNGATIKFSDQATTAAQHGLLSYYHSDGASYGSGNAFVLHSTEANMSFVVKGKVMYSEGIYTTPATGTGGGTRKDSNWDSAYTWGNHADEGYVTGNYLPLAGGVMSGNIGRSAHNKGYLVGGYNNIGASATATNPIFTIGTSYLPAVTTLGNMYGIGYTRGDASFMGIASGSGWGMYVASVGVARVWLDGSTGDIVASGTLSASGYNDSNWNTSYGWGDHSTAGYTGDQDLSGYLLNTTDILDGYLSVVTKTVANGGTYGENILRLVGTSQVTSTNTAVTPTNELILKPAMPAGYGNDGYALVWEQQSGADRTLYYRTSGAGTLSLDVEGTVTTTGGNSTNWNTAYGWGNHASVGYITSYTNTTYSAGTGIDLNGTTFRLNGGAIPTGVNLDTYRSTGIYSQNSNSQAAAGSNYPVAQAGVLEVWNDDYGNGLFTTQRYKHYNSTADYSRVYYNGSWSAWRNLAQDTDTVYSLPFTDNSSNWDTAYGWGDHASAGYQAGGNYLLDSTDTFTGSLSINGDIRGTGQQLILNAGESYSVATAQTNEYVYVNAEQGLEVNSDTGNWSGGWAARKTALLRGDLLRIDGEDLTKTNVQNFKTAYGWGNHASRYLLLTGGNVSGDVTVDAKLRARGSQSDNNYTTAALWTESYNTTTTGIAFHISGTVGKYLEMRTNGTLYWANNEVLTSASTLNASNMTTGTLPDVFSPSTRYNIGLIDGSSSGTRDKLRVWDSGTYSIGMKDGYSYGHLGGGSTDYAMSFQMSNNNTRGFWWGDVTHTDAQGSMSLTTDGNLVVATSISIGQGETITAPSTTPLYVEGSVSGSTVFEVQGTQGQLFSVTDDLTGTIFAASDISGIPILEVNASGVVTIDDTLNVYGDVIAYYSSDMRLKDNVKPITNAIDKMKMIGGYEFDWNDLSKNEGHDVGVMAQEIEKVLPEVVTTRKNGYKAVKYDKLTALLIEANKELIKRVEELENKIK